MYEKVLESVGTSREYMEILGEERGETVWETIGR